MVKERKLTKLEENVVKFLRAECHRLKVAHAAMVKLKKETKVSKQLAYARKSIIEIEAQHHLMATVADVVHEILISGEELPLEEAQAEVT